MEAGVEGVASVEGVEDAVDEVEGGTLKTVKIK